MKRFLPFLLLAVLCGSGAAAQEPLPEADERLRSEVHRLSERSRTWDRVLARMPRISGYLQLGYEADDAGTSEFFIKRVRVLLQGDISPRMDYCVHAELVSPALMDLYLRYKPLRALNFQLGQFKLPFSIENTEYPPLKIEFIDYPLALTRLVSFNDVCGMTGATGRDLGLMAYGGFFAREGYDILSYNVGVFNGEGINTLDANKSKDLVARLTVRPVAGLQIAGSYYWGEYGKEYLRRIRYGAGIGYDRGIGVARSEYIYGRTGDLRSDGWYVMGGLRAARRWLFAVRCEAFTENRDDSDTRQMNYTAGITWQPVKHLRCQLNYTYEHYSAPAAADRHVVAVMMSGIF